MKKLITVIAAAVLIQSASLAQAQISFNINVGGPPVVIAQPPEFLYPPELGFGVAVGVPYDLYYLSGIYYIYRGGGWYRTTRYGGDWIRMRPRELPYELRRYRVARIHEYRDREYRVYTRDRMHYRERYRDRYFRPDHVRVEEHRDMRGPAGDRRHDMGEHRGGRPGPEGRPGRQGNDRRDEGGREGGGERRDSGHGR